MSVHRSAPRRADSPSEASSAIPTMGVEEEFLLVDATTLELAPTAEPVLARADDADGTTHPEATRHQVETASPIARTAPELRSFLLDRRRRFTEAAAANGCRLVAGGAPVLVPAGGPLLVDAPRRHEQAGRYGALTETFVNCGCHVHVGTLAPDAAARVVNRVRPWLPTLIALGANSPFQEGRDTGHCSWRAVIGTTWPASGIPPRLDSAAHYDRILRFLIESGVVKDAKMIYWDARPSSLWPTVEIRASDVSASVDEAVLQAVLTRALVSHAVRAAREDVPEPRVRDDVLVSARWRAARDGFEGQAVHPFTGETVSAHFLADTLIDLVHTDLEAAGDLPYVLETVASLRRNGCGAQRQREAFERRRRFTDVVSYLADVTERQDP